MTATLDNISQRVAYPLEGGRWEVRFASANPGMHHQLYLNAELAAWTDSPQDRRFPLSEMPHARELTIAAVDADSRQENLWDQLGLSREHPWICTLRVVRPCASAGLQLVVRGDHATGQIDPQPLAVEDLSPAWLGLGGFGLTGFGLGGWGVGLGAPGWGRGGFGAGPFGCGAEVLALRLPLQEPGSHQLQLQTVDAHGRESPTQTIDFQSTPPPPPAAYLNCLAYDAVNHILTLEAY